MLEEQGGGFVPEESAGGFFVDESSGGFVPEEPTGGFVADEPDLSSEITHIPLSLIPTALQILDLPPDDEQVLSVFRNAASGWANSRSRSSEEAELVSKRDWRSVCAVLLAPQGADEQDADESEDGSGEEYMDEDEHDSDSGAGEDMDDDDDYADTRDVPQKKSRRTRGKVSRESPDEDLPSSRPITARQKEASREAFSLFFPDVPESKLNSQRLTVSDLVRVAKDLKEKLSYDQVVSLFHSGPRTAADQEVTDNGNAVDHIIISRQIFSISFRL